jgi:predicted nucleotidyltransferase
MDEIATKCKNILAHYYQTRLKGLILYGSAARNQETPESDVDLLVLLDAPFDYLRELRRIVDLLYPLQLETNHLISAKPARADEFEQGALQLYRNIKQDGILL